MLDILVPLSEQLLAIQYRPYLRDFIKENSFEQRLTIIRGQRGVGKSTALIQLLHPHASDKRLYIPVDHFLVKNFSLYAIAEAFAQQGGRYLAFDEIHQYPAWSQELKSIYDTFPQLTLYASGSSALAIHRGSHDLSRRAVIYTLAGMSFREYLELSQGLKIPPMPLEQLLNEHTSYAKTILAMPPLQQTPILSLFFNYLETGYYPYSLEFKNKNVFYLTLEQNLHTVLESDLPAVHPHLSGASINKMKRLLSFLSTHVPFTVDLKELKAVLEIADERTLKQYMQMMEEAGIITLLHKNDKKMDGLKKADKIYPNNTCQLFALNAPSVINKGTLREVFFISMLKAKHDVHLPTSGDFLIDKKITFEVGGKNKTFDQIKNIPFAYLAIDDIELGYNNKIPLWLLGFLY